MKQDSLGTTIGIETEMCLLHGLDELDGALVTVALTRHADGVQFKEGSSVGEVHILRL